MFHPLASHKLLMLLCLMSCLAITASAQHSQSSALSQVDFPTSGSEAAQAHFLRGVAALHSFWYEEALEAFREATKVDPGFVMGYWGEAMAHNHPLWNEQDTERRTRGSARLPETGERALVPVV
jgi:hypothetical protein